MTSFKIPAKKGGWVSENINNTNRRLYIKSTLWLGINIHCTAFHTQIDKKKGGKD